MGEGAPGAQSGQSGQEIRDAEKVDEAMSLLLKRQEKRAEDLLMAVAANTPGSYVNEYDAEDGALAIKFWSQQEFVWYVLHQHQGKDRNLLWVPNAYPRAHYYLGLIAVKAERFAEGLRWLETGYALEPHPAFTMEKAKAFGAMGRRQEAIDLYASVIALNDQVEGSYRAAAMRQKAVLLIDEGDLEGAEQLLRESLVIELDSKVAANELKYLAHLRSGGSEAVTESVLSGGKESNAGECSVCGRTMEKGTIVPVEGRLIYLCQRCQRKIDKRWWEFWK